MRHCRQCRADAVGLLGEDRSEEFTLEKIADKEVVYDLERRRAYHEQVEAERQAQHDAKLQALAAAAADDGSDPDMKVLVAAATKGQGKVNQHFGHASEFQIFEVSRSEALFVGHRRVDLYCQGGWGEDEQLPSIVNAINDCHAVLVAKIGACPRDELQAAGIEPVDEYAHEFIEKAALAWFAGYRERIARGALAHRVRGPVRLAPVRGGVPGRRLHQVGLMPAAPTRSSETSMIQPNVTITPAAQKFIRRMVAFFDTPAGGLRLLVTPGGCSGYSAEFTVEAAPRAGDSELPVAGTRLYLPADSRLMLEGMVMDFADTPTQSGFVITQPGAAPCACTSAGDAAAPAPATISLASITRKAPSGAAQ